MAVPRNPDKAAAPPKESDGFVRAIARGFGVVEALGHPPGRHTLTEVARLAGLTRATSRRILATLVAMRYCANDGRYFQLRPRALGLGLSYLSSLPFWAASQRTVETLRDETSESCALAVLDETDIVYLDPPYWVFKGKKQDKFYEHEYDKKNHVDLRDALLAHSGNWLLSYGYPRPLYHYIPDWAKSYWKSEYWRLDTEAKFACELYASRDDFNVDALPTEGYPMELGRPRAQTKAQKEQSDWPEKRYELVISPARLNVDYAPIPDNAFIDFLSKEAEGK